MLPDFIEPLLDVKLHLLTKMSKVSHNKEPLDPLGGHFDHHYNFIRH